MSGDAVLSCGQLADRSRRTPRCCDDGPSSGVPTEGVFKADPLAGSTPDWWCWSSIVMFGM